MNAIKFLLNEHLKVRVAFREIENKPHLDATKKKMFDDLSHDLIRHEIMEHKVWYPRFKDDDRIDDTVKHLISEEKKAAEAIKRFETIKTEEEWDKRFEKLKEDVEHHATEEETKLFPKIEKILSAHELEVIGKEMEHFKENY